MTRTILKGLAARKFRLLSSLTAVVLGVALMAGTLILTDTVKHTFDVLFKEASAGTAVTVRTRSALQAGGNQMAGARTPVPDSLLKTVSSVSGVRHADGSIFGFAQLTDRQGKPIAPQAPTFGSTWSQFPELTPLTLRRGRRPERSTEVAIDAATVKKYGFKLGDQVKVLFQGPTRTFTLVGVAGFGKADNLAGATIAAFDTATAQDVMNRKGTFDTIDVSAASGFSPTALQRNIVRVLPANAEVVLGTQVAAENNKGVQQGLGFFSTFLLIFAVIAVFVGSFIIFNTFSILVAQRTRELALLRALGASRRQVRWSVLAEAAVVGLVGSVLGLVIGAGVAKGLVALLKALGIDTPTSSLQFRPRTVVVSLVVGLAVTAAASLSPARRAARVPPVAAMRDVVIEPAGSLRRRLAAGVVVAVLGNVLIFVGLFGGVRNGIAIVGPGAMVAFIGVAMLIPAVAGPLARAIGAPLPRLFGLPGRLARANAARNPRRTASTAAALTVGIGLVGAVTVMAASMKASVVDVVKREVRADYVLRTKNFQGFSPDAARLAASRPGVVAATGTRLGGMDYGSAHKRVTGADPVALPHVVRFAMDKGSFANLERGQLLVDTAEANRHGWKVGDTLTFTFARTGEQRLTLGGVYKTNQFLGSYLISTATFDANFTDLLDQLVFVKGGSKAALKPVSAAFPAVEIQSRQQFVDAQKKQVNQILTLVYALLLLAIVIALIGIANTMALAIVERTREIGLIRAVGMSRRQLRRMIRWESGTVSLLGAVVGIAIGILFGLAFVKALADLGINSVAIPVGTLALFLVISLVAGVTAAALPARRAAKLDVLSAIATE